MGEIRTTFDGLDWYYEPTTTKTAEHVISVGDSVEYPNNMSAVTINDHNIERFDLYIDEIERLNNFIDVLIRLIEQQNKTIELLTTHTVVMKDKKDG